MKSSMSYIVIWLIAGSIAMFMALQLDTAAFVDGHYIPVGNDSFYHARRILDAALSDRGFYQFDNMIHVPEGSWLNWPWAYDYLLSRALLLAIWVSPTVDPMGFLAHVPVAWVFVNAGLLTLIGRHIGLGAPLTAVGLLGFALLPLTQTLHGLGIIDHHYIELTFVLATILTGLRFFSEGSSTADAISLGVVLGIAPAFHNGLFILQIPVLACAFILWSRQAYSKIANVKLLAGSLVATTLLVVIPSAPFQDMQFEFWTLSWFHLYVAVCSAVCLLFFGWKSVSKTNAGLFSGLAIIMIVPVFTKMLIGTAFLKGDLILLSNILEVRSPVARLSEVDGILRVATNSSWLIFLSPILLLVFAWRVIRGTDPAKIYLSLFAVFGMLLMLTQTRLHPFGSWVFLLGSLLLVEDWRRKREGSRLATTAVALLALIVAFQPPLKTRLFVSYPPGLTKNYAASRSLFPSLAKACEEKPGAVLSYNNDGHYIRYHTGCSVLTNNFLLTPLHEKKILEANEFLNMTPAQLLTNAPHIDYVFVRMYEIFRTTAEGMEPVSVEEVKQRNAPLFVALTFATAPPNRFRLIDEVRTHDDRDFAYARVFQIIHDE